MSRLARVINGTCTAASSELLGLLNSAAATSFKACGLHTTAAAAADGTDPSAAAAGPAGRQNTARRDAPQRDRRSPHREGAQRRAPQHAHDAAAQSDAEAAGGTPRPDLVEQYLSTANMARGEFRAAKYQEIVDNFKRSTHDTGSVEVQVALLTEKMADLRQHLSKHRKDYSSRRGLEVMMSQRRRLLIYLRKQNFERYARLLSSLGLNDIFYEQGHYKVSKFKVGSGLKWTGDAAAQ